MPDTSRETQLYEELIQSKPPVQQSGLFGGGRKDKEKILDEDGEVEQAPKAPDLPPGLPQDARSRSGEGSAPEREHPSATHESGPSGAGYIGSSTHRYADGTTAKRKTVLLRPDQDLSLKRYCAEHEGESISSVIQHLLDDAGFFGGKVPGRRL